MRGQTDSWQETIVALATPPGRSAIAVVRLSGPATRSALARVAPGLREPIDPRRATLATITDETGDAIDQGLITLFPAPASYTGEDCAEISVHGSPAVVARLLAALNRCGARLARPGEFTERAFLRGKLDLPRAEAVIDLIEARTVAAARRSFHRIEGGLSRRLQGTREDLLTAAAQLDAAIDFSEDVGDAALGEAARRLRTAIDDLERLAATHETGRLLRAGCRAVILGRPNAGKSTLFNALVGSARAIVTEIPGTTRDTLEAGIDVEGIPVTLVDTAGLRETKDVVERLGVERARQEGSIADVVLYVLEAAAGMTDEDHKAIASAGARRVLRVANKIDRATAEQTAAAEDAGAMAICGLAPDAGEKLRGPLAREITAGLDMKASDEVLASLRQRDLVERSRAAAAEGLATLSRGDSPEYAAAQVHDALDAMADLFGETTAEDVLERIFSAFCVGK